MIEQLGNLAQGSPMVPVSRGIFHMLDGFEEPVGFDFDHEIGDRFEDLSALANISVADGPLESFAGDDFHDPCFLTKFTQGGLLRCLPDLDQDSGIGRTYQLDMESRQPKVRERRPCPEARDYADPPDGEIRDWSLAH